MRLSSKHRAKSAKACSDCAYSRGRTGAGLNLMSIDDASPACTATPGDSRTYTLKGTWHAVTAWPVAASSGLTKHLGLQRTRTSCYQMFQFATSGSQRERRSSGGHHLKSTCRQVYHGIPETKCFLQLSALGYCYAERKPWWPSRRLDWSAEPHLHQNSMRFERCSTNQRLGLARTG